MSGRRQPTSSSSQHHARSFVVAVDVVHKILAGQNPGRIDWTILFHVNAIISKNIHGSEQHSTVAYLAWHFWTVPAHSDLEVYPGKLWHAAGPGKPPGGCHQLPPAHATTRPSAARSQPRSESSFVPLLPAAPQLKNKTGNVRSYSSEILIQSRQMYRNCPRESVTQFYKTFFLF